VKKEDSAMKNFSSAAIAVAAMLVAFVWSII